MSTIRHWIRKEIISLVPPIIYFAVCFNLLHFAQTLMLQPGDIRYTSYFGATLGAIFAGKIILIVETLPFINAFPKKPIICNICWKFCIYGFFVLLVQALDYAVQQYYHSKNWAIVYTSLHADLTHPRFWGIQIFVMIFFLIFITFSELVRVTGKEKMKKIFFG